MVGENQLLQVVLLVCCDMCIPKNTHMGKNVLVISNLFILHFHLSYPANAYQFCFQVLLISSLCSSHNAYLLLELLQKSFPLKSILPLLHLTSTLCSS